MGNIENDWSLKVKCLQVLDAPSLQDDFYLNLVDWSSQNVLAVGLGTCVYLWSASNSKVSLNTSSLTTLRTMKMWVVWAVLTFKSAVLLSGNEVVWLGTSWRCVFSTMDPRGFIHINWYKWWSSSGSYFSKLASDPFISLLICRLVCFVSHSC